MQILPVHYKLSKPVSKYDEIKDEASQMIRFTERGNVKGYYNKAHAVAHSEVSETPYAFFVVSRECVAEGLFPSHVIINPKIIKSPLHHKNNPQTFTGTSTTDIKELFIIPNSTEDEEPCLQFPFRKAKRITRYDKIEVSYQVPVWYGLKTIKVELNGIASRIFQHCYDHTVADNIFFKGEPVLKWWESIGKPLGYGKN